MKILLINPNTSEFVTDRAVTAARSNAAASTTIEGVTGTIGAPIINSETDIVVGAYSAVHLAARHAARFDAVGLAVSFDTGLAALREMLSIPVAGMAQAAIRQALQLGDRITLISFGQRTKPLYEDLAMQYMAPEYLSGVHCIHAMTDTQLRDPDCLKSRIQEEVEAAVRKFDCNIVVLLATAFAGLGEGISTKVPVVDALTAIIKLLESSTDNREVTELLTNKSWPERKIIREVSPELAHLYQTFPGA